MVFSKTFPRTIPGSNYPVWEEINLSEKEEREVEELCCKANLQIMDTCLADAKFLAIKQGINTDENCVQLALALFEKQASHLIFWKESKAKEKFDYKFKL